MAALAVLLLSCWYGGSGCRSEARELAAAGEIEDSAGRKGLEETSSQEQLLSERLAEARRYFQNRRYEASLAVLQELERQSERPLHPEVLYWQARIAQERQDPALALFYLKKIIDPGSGLQEPAAGLLFEVYERLGALSYEAADFEQAYRYYLDSVNLARSDSAVPAQTWLRLAEIAYYIRSDREAAKSYLLQKRRAAAGAEADSDSSLTVRLLRGLRWSNLTAPMLGLEDNNISALGTDGDDLWVGTWDGSVCRYSLGSADSTVLKRGGESLTARTVRSIEIGEDKVWIGTYQGLYQYSKHSSQWQEVKFFGGDNPWKVEALEAVGGTLYVGTLGRGLWRSQGSGWVKFVQGVLPGELINCLLASGDYLLIGTMNLGLVILDLRTGRLQSFDGVNPDLDARNVIMLLAEGEDILWIGTYGQGLYRWDRRSNSLVRYSKATGELGDDWVLCGIRTEAGLYFGTFGGGVSHKKAGSGSWERIGLREGLSALDISAAACRAPRVFFATLGSGVSILDESVVLEDAGEIE